MSNCVQILPALLHPFHGSNPTRRRFATSLNAGRARAANYLGMRSKDMAIASSTRPCDALKRACAYVCVYVGSGRRAVEGAAGHCRAYPTTIGSRQITTRILITRNTGTCLALQVSACCLAPACMRKLSSRSRHT